MRLKNQVDVAGTKSVEIVYYGCNSRRVWQLTIEQVLCHLNLRSELSGRGPQLRARCPLHSQAGAKDRTFSVHLGKNIFQCFDPECATHGNVLDLWAALHNLPLYEAAVHVAGTFGLLRNREEATVRGTV